MRVKIIDRGGIRSACCEDAPELLQLRDRIEFACDAEELFDAVPCSERARTKKKRYDWREEEKKHDPER